MVMKHSIRFLLTTGALAACGALVSLPALAQAPSDSQNRQSDSTSYLASGTTLSAQLSQTVDSKKAQPGDTVIAQTTEAIKSDGKVVLPKGTKVMGHVTRATARANGDSDSVLAVQFDRAVLKNGHSVSLQTVVQALAAEPRVAAVTGDDLQPAPNMQGGVAGNRSAVGGVGNTIGGAASGAASTVPRTIENESSLASSTVSGVGRSEVGLSSSGDLIPTSRGVFGLAGLSLNAKAADSTEGSVISSSGKNVHLDSGTQILLSVQAAIAVTAQR
jgi:hypothetical protein